MDYNRRHVALVNEPDLVDYFDDLEAAGDLQAPVRWTEVVLHVDDEESGLAFRCRHDGHSLEFVTTREMSSRGAVHMMHTTKRSI